MLRAAGGRWVKIHGSEYQERGTPDVLGCWRGRFVAVEFKQPGENPTKIQLKFLNEIVAAGGIVSVVTTVEEVAILIRELQRLEAP
jgi:Holliday junction resolvase